MNIIVAVDKNWGIGNQGQLLCSLPSDMRFFVTTTKGKTVVMGRKTLESLPGGKPLTDRQNIVFSKTLKRQAGITVVQSIGALAKQGLDLSNAYVIGGEQIYAELMPYCDYAFVTKMDAAFQADTYFPNLDEDPNWEQADVIYAFKEEDIEAEIVKYYNKSPLKLPSK